MENSCALPLEGISLACLRAFVSEHDGAYSWDNGTGCPAPARSLAEMTTAEVMLSIVRTETAHTRRSYAELLKAQV
jgi:hypothetical protein